MPILALANDYANPLENEKGKLLRPDLTGISQHSNKRRDMQWSDEVTCTANST